MRPIVALRDFVDKLHGTQAPTAPFAAAAPTGLRSQGITPDPIHEFLAVKDYLLARYANVEVSNSFADAAGHAIDCIKISQQPTLRGGAGPAVAPPLEPLPGATVPAAAAISPPLAEGRQDQFGNSAYCPPGYVPILRVTPERIRSVGGLERFFQKAPGGGKHPSLGSGRKRAVGPGPGVGAGGVAVPFQSVGGAIHAYAHASQALVGDICTGARSWLNLWTPDPSPGVFSLSQQWVAGDNGSGLQTIEGGWHVYPSLYNDPSPVTRLFIYWTADGYQNTGNYNLANRPGQPGFVQTDNSWVLGGAFQGSTAGGEQRGFMMAWQRDPANGNWWLYLQGTANPVAVGYFPATIYGSGALSQSALSVDFGGEVCSQLNANQTGPMGSGQEASAGWQQAAFHKEIAYQTTGGWVPATLMPDQRDAPAYTINLTNASSSPWATNFFFGGAGGQFA